MKHLTSGFLTQLRSSSLAAPVFGDVMKEIVSEAWLASSPSININMHSMWYDNMASHIADTG